MAITVSLTDGQTYTGTVALTVTVTGATPTAAGVQLGRYLWPATRVGSSTSWSAGSWDTAMKEGYQSEPSPSNHLVYVRGYATVGGVVQYGDWITVYTGNYSYRTSTGGVLPAGGWRSATAYEDDLSSKSAFLAKHAAAVVGQAYATVIPDPLVAGRNAVKVTLPDTAWSDADMPTDNPRYQAQSPSVFREGDEAYFGFPYLIPTSTSAAVGAGGFPDVGVSALSAGKPGSGKHIAIMQVYGPQATNTQYPSGTGTDQRGAITNLDANRSYAADPLGVFQIGGNQLNAGFPADLLEIPYNRGKWTDFGLGIHFSADVKRGWIELYVNLGDGRGLQPYEFFDGRTRLPYVGLWPMQSTPSLDTSVAVGGSYNHRMDMQIYRTRGVYASVTMTHGAMRIGPTIAAVDPLSYATLDVQAPVGPVLTSDAPSHNAVTLRFSGATDNVAVVDLIVRRSGKDLVTLPPTATEYTDTTVVAATEYKYAVIARDAVPLEGRSNTITVTTKAAPDKEPPSAPVVTVSEVTATSARLTWPAAPDNVGTTGYLVKKGSALVSDQPELTFVVTGLAPSTTTLGTVSAYDAAKNVSQSATWTITTTAAAPTAPAAPTGVTVTAVTATSATVSWTGSAGATGYRVYVNGAVTATATGTSAGLTDLASATSHTVRVTALGGLESPQSSPVTFTTSAGPPAPTIAAPHPVLAQANLTALTIRWPAVAGAVMYEVTRADVILGETSGLTFTELHLQPDTAYTYRVRARGVGVSATSAPLTISTLDGGTTLALATVHGSVTDCRLNPLALKQIRLKFELSQAATQGERLFVTDPIIVTPAPDGTFVVDLFETVLMSPAAWYNVSATWLVGGQASAYELLPYKLRVTTGGGAFGDLIVSPPPPGSIGWGFGPPDADYLAYSDISGERARVYMLGAPV